MKTVFLTFFCLVFMTSYSYADQNTTDVSKKLRGKKDIYTHGSSRIIEPIDEYLDMSRLTIYGLIKEEGCMGDKCPQNILRYEWSTGAWDECVNDSRARQVHCVDSTSHENVSDSLCLISTKPASTASCANNNNADEKYAWLASAYGQCDNGCGHGYKSRVISCYDKNFNKVDDSYCSSAEPYPTTQLGDTNSDPNAKPCFSLDSCPYHWVVGSWSVCTEGVQNRDVTCQDGSGQIIDNDLCYSQSWNSPDTASYDCESRNSYHFEYGSWGECITESRYQSSQYRTAKCIDGNGQEVDNEICEIEGLYMQTQKSCAKWILSNWSECTPEKVRTRSLHCGSPVSREAYDEFMCDGFEKPNVSLSESCTVSSYKWYTHPWEGRCNNLPAIRNIECRQIFTGKTVADSLCDASSKPSELSGPWDEDVPSAECSYEWRYGSWEKCALNNGRFEHIQNVTCAKYGDGGFIENGDVNDSYCQEATGEENPMNTTEPTLCNYSWSIGEWGVCDHQTLTKTRTVQCKEEQGEVFADSLCVSQEAKAETVQTCELIFQWEFPHLVGPSDWYEDCWKPEKNGRRDLALCESWTACPQDGLSPFRTRKKACVATEPGVHLFYGHVVPDSVCTDSQDTIGSPVTEYMMCKYMPYNNIGYPYTSGCSAGCNKPGLAILTINDCRWQNKYLFTFWPPHANNQVYGYDAILCLNQIMHDLPFDNTQEISRSEYLSAMSDAPYINTGDVVYTNSDRTSLTYQVPCVGSCNGSWVLSTNGQCMFNSHFSAGGFMNVDYACQDTSTGEIFTSPDMMPCDSDLKPASTQIGCYYNVSDPSEMARINGLISQYVTDPSQYDNGQIVPGSELEALMYNLNGYQP